MVEKSYAQGATYLTPHPVKANVYTLGETFAFDSGEFRRFVKCSSLKDADKLFQDFFPLFGMQRPTIDENSPDPIKEIGRCFRDYLDFCKVLSDGMKLRGVSNGDMSESELESLNGSVTKHDRTLQYKYQLSTSHAYSRFLMDSCFRFIDDGEQTNPKVARTKSGALLLLIDAADYSWLFSYLLGVHLVDVAKLTDEDGLPCDICLSLASQIWLTLGESLRRGRIIKCKHCGAPAIATGRQQANALYCSDSCRAMHTRGNAKKANPAR